MKKLILAIVVGATFAVVADTVLNPKQKEFFNNQRICVGQTFVDEEFNPLPNWNGAKYALLQWKKNGKPDGVTTQELYKVVGEKNMNPGRRLNLELKALNTELTNRVANLTANLEELNLDLSSLSNRFDKIYAKLEARRAKTREVVEDLDAAIAKYPLLKTVLTAIKNKINIDDDDDE